MDIVQIVHACSSATGLGSSIDWPKHSCSKIRASACAAMDVEVCDTVKHSIKQLFVKPLCPERAVRVRPKDLEALPVSSGGHVLSCEEITCLQALGSLLSLALHSQHLPVP